MRKKERFRCEGKDIHSFLYKNQLHKKIARRLEVHIRSANSRTVGARIIRLSKKIILPKKHFKRINRYVLYVQNLKFSPLNENKNTESGEKLSDSCKNNIVYWKVSRHYLFIGLPLCRRLVRSLTSGLLLYTLNTHDEAAGPIRDPTPRYI